MVQYEINFWRNAYTERHILKIVNPSLELKLKNSNSLYIDP